MDVLVTGAAGYIGSVVVQELIEEGDRVVALDNLELGHREAVAPEALFVQADLGDREELDLIFKSHRIEAVVHLASLSSVAESMSAPERYFRTSVTYGMNLVDAMIRHGVNKLAFSSTVSVYGSPESVPIRESHPTVPISPYGESKLVFERILHWYGYAHGLNYISLRCFNVAGARGRLGEDHDPAPRLVSSVLKVAQGQLEHVPLIGTDFPTKDGSSIRDYTHVADVARAHLLALKHLETDRFNKAYNLGAGRGYSVLEVIEVARNITGATIRVVSHPRRPGDPPVLVANSELARLELGWEPEYREIETIVESAWRWQQEHPHGYRG